MTKKRWDSEASYGRDINPTVPFGIQLIDRNNCVIGIGTD